MKTKEQKRYLVTGGCGFIGSHLVDELINNGHEVVVLDDLSTGKKENLNNKAKLLVGDATDYSFVEKAFDGVDGCFHLAAVASVEKSTHEWVRAHTVNITATVNIFQAASRCVPHVPVVYTSSAAVYGDCKMAPISETVLTRPITAYGVDKLSCDLHGRVAWNVHHVPNIGVRPFNVYGPRQDPSSPYSGVISIFTDRIFNGQIITIFGDGEQVRDFVYVSDAVKVFVAAMDKLHVSKHGHDEVNICTGVATTINRLSETIARIYSRSMYRVYKPARNGDIRVSIGDALHLKSALNIKLNTTLQDGLEFMFKDAVLDVERKVG